MITKEETAEEIYSELQHNRIINREEYDKRLKELANLYELGEEANEDIDTILHNKYSFGFCEMCGDVIFYDEDNWYDLWGTFYDEWERERIDERLPKYEKELGTDDIQDVCSVCFAKLVEDEDEQGE